MGSLASGREIRLPEEAALAGSVLIAERFMEGEGDDATPIDFPVWPGSNGMRPSTWFNVHVEAHPGDVVVLSPGAYEAQIWIFTPRITIMTDSEADELAVIEGTIEIDADRVTLERIAVTNSSNPGDSGHGIEVNRSRLDHVVIRECRSSGNRWTGIHIIGVNGTIQEMRIEDCELINNGGDGMDATSTRRLIVTGCTITGNGWDLAIGVGVRIGYYVESIEMHDNVIEDNRFADVWRRE